MFAFSTCVACRHDYCAVAFAGDFIVSGVVPAKTTKRKQRGAIASGGQNAGATGLYILRIGLRLANYINGQFI